MPWGSGYLLVVIPKIGIKEGEVSADRTGIPRFREEEPRRGKALTGSGQNRRMVRPGAFRAIPGSDSAGWNREYYRIPQQQFAMKTPHDFSSGLPGTGFPSIRNDMTAPAWEAG